MRRYNRDWPDSYSDLDVELVCFKHGLTPKQGGLGKAEHFWNITEILWGPDSRKPFVRNPWSEKMILEACKWKYLGVTGPGNAAKSDTFALWGIVNFLCNPANTLVLVTSTSLTESKLRIWGAIEEYWKAAPGLPGKIVSSVGAIRYEDPQTKERGSERCGLKLVAAGSGHEDEAEAALIGIKRSEGVLLLIGDELPELTPAILKAAKGNLSSQPKFQFIGIGNAKSPFDAHGELLTPKNGWKSLPPDPEEYETELGYAIRFDAHKSPNILAGKVIYPFLPKQEWIDEQKANLGENSLGYWRMVRGWYSPDGSTEGIYSEADITTTGAEERTVKWSTPPIPVAGQDPSFTNGGDKTIIQFGLFGMCEHGYYVLLYTDRVEMISDTTLQKTRNFQIAENTMKACVARHVTPENFAHDATGAGGPYGDIIAEIWSPDVHRVTFGGSATDIPVGNVGPKPASRCYTDRSSELWFAGKEFMRSGQIKGVDNDMARDLVSRMSTTVKRGKDLLQQAEPKKLTKKRTGRSPDRGEAALILLDLCRARHKFRAQTIVIVNQSARKKFRRFANEVESFERTAEMNLLGDKDPLPQEAHDSGGSRRTAIAVGDGWAEEGLL